MAASVTPFHVCALSPPPRFGQCSSSGDHLPRIQLLGPGFYVIRKCEGKMRAWRSFRLPGALQDSLPIEQRDNENEQLSVLFAMRSQYNDIVLVDSPKARFLLLDSTKNVHSIYNKADKWTGSYWDEFASLPAIIPQGPVAILGLGGGTVAHLLLELWPALQLEGWEIDDMLVDQAREHLGLFDLEKCNADGGLLKVHIDDAFSPSAIVPGGFAGIVVDLFSDGKVLPQLQEVDTWLELYSRLMPSGRIMVNCGGEDCQMLSGHDQKIHSRDDAWMQNFTIVALSKALPGNVSWRKLSESESQNYLALTGPMPDLDVWASSLPDRLRSSLRQWRPCNLDCLND